jgi:hypothetical protein
VQVVAVALNMHQTITRILYPLELFQLFRLLLIALKVSVRIGFKKIV